MAEPTKEEIAAFIAKITIQGEAKVDKASKDISNFSKKLKSLQKISGGVEKSIGALGKAFNKIGAIAGAGFGLQKSLNTLQSYSKSLVNVSSQFAKYGVSAVQLEKRMSSLSNTLSITRKETMELYSQFEKAFPYTSLSGVEKILKNIKNVVGANSDAMKEMASAVAKVTAQFPELQKSAEDLSMFDKKRLDAHSKLLLLSGKISLTEAKRLQDYLVQNKMDDTAAKKNKERIETMQKLKKFYEDIAITVGKELMPMVKYLVKFLKEHKKTITFIVKLLAVWGTRFLVAKTIVTTMLTTFVGIKASLVGIVSLINKGSLGMAAWQGSSTGILGSLGHRGTAMVSSKVSHGFGGSGLSLGAGAAKKSGKAFGVAASSRMAKTGAIIGKTISAIMIATIAIGISSLIKGALKVDAKKGGGHAYASTGIDMATYGVAGAAIGGLPGAAVGVGIGAAKGVYEQSAALSEDWKEYDKQVTSNLEATKKLNRVNKQNTEYLKNIGFMTQEDISSQKRINDLRKKADKLFDEAREWDGIDEDKQKEYEATVAKANAIEKKIKRKKAKYWMSEYQDSATAAISTVKKSRELGLSGGAGYAQSLMGGLTEKRKSAREKFIQLAQAGGKEDIVTKLQDATGKDVSNIGTKLVKDLESKKSDKKISKKWEDAKNSVSELLQEESRVLPLLAHINITLEKQKALREASIGFVDATVSRLMIQGTSEENLAQLRIRMGEANKSLTEEQTRLEQKVLLQKGYINQFKGEDNRLTKNIVKSQEKILKLAKEITILGRDPSKEDQARNINDQLNNEKKHLKELEQQRSSGQSSIKQHQSNRILAEAEIERKVQERIKLEFTEFELLKNIAQAQVGLTKAHAGYLDAIIQKMVILGKLTKGEIADAMGKVSESFVKQEEKIDAAITKGRVKLEDMNKKKLDGAEIDKQRAVIRGLEAQKESILAQKTQVIVKAVKSQYTLEKDIASTRTQQLTTLNQMVDSLGVGVGASAEMRMQAIASQEQVTIQIENMINGIKRAEPEWKKNRALVKEILQLENEKLQSINKQVQMSKALREGWVSALNAMTVGTGRITKIMITRQNNLRQGLANLGLTISHVSGSIAAGAGTMAPERFTVGRGGGLRITGEAGGYQTDTGPDIEKVRVLQKRGVIKKEAAERMIRDLHKKATSGTGVARSFPGVTGREAVTVPGKSGVRKTGAAPTPATPATTPRSSPTATTGSSSINWKKTRTGEGITLNATINVSIEELPRVMMELAKATKSNIK